jgi:hypothetical protein
VGETVGVDIVPGVEFEVVAFEVVDPLHALSNKSKSKSTLNVRLPE